MYRKYYKTDLPEEEPFIWYKDPIIVGCGIILIICFAWIAYHHYGTADGGSSGDNSGGGAPASVPANSKPKVHFEEGTSLFKRVRRALSQAVHKKGDQDLSGNQQILQRIMRD